MSDAEKRAAWAAAGPATREFLREWGLFKLSFGELTEDGQTVTWGERRVVGEAYPAAIGHRGD